MNGKPFILRRILCVSTGPKKCKLSLPVEFFPLTPIIHFLPKREEEFLQHLYNAVWRWSEAFERQGLTVTEAEVFLPVIGEYRELEKRITEKFPSSKIPIKISSGANIVIGDTSMELSQTLIEKDIAYFAGVQS